MEFLFTMVVPLTISGVALYGVGRRVDVYSALIHGAEEGLETLLRIVPALVGLLTAVSMLRASGALDLAARLLDLWAGLLSGAGGGGDAGLYGDHLLYHRGLLRRGGGDPNPLCPARRPVRRPHRISGRRLGGPAVLRGMNQSTRMALG